MTVVFFKTGASPPVGFGCTDGRIDFAELGRKFKLDPTSIELNGLVFSKERLKSELKWGEIKADFEEVGKPVGKEDDPVIVTGEAAESTEGGSNSKKRKSSGDLEAELAEKKRKSYVDLEAELAEHSRYIEDLLAPPDKLPIEVADIKNFLSQTSKPLPVSVVQLVSLKQPKLVKLFSPAEILVAELVNTASATFKDAPNNEADSSHKLRIITGDFLVRLNDLASPEHQLLSLRATMDSGTNPSTTATPSALIHLKRPNFTLYIRNALILRWENKFDPAGFVIALKENTEKLKVWSYLYYGNLPYVIGGCCGGNQFQWLRLAKKGNSIVADSISEMYDLSARGGVIRVLHSVVQMHRLLQLLQKHLSEVVPITLYQEIPCMNGIVIVGPEFVVKTVKGLKPERIDFLESLYDSIADSGYLIQLQGRIKRLKDSAKLKLHPVGHPRAEPGDLKQLENATHDMLHGLVELHKAGFTHRDLRWENCIRDFVQGEAKWILIDLECAGPDGDTWEGQRLGTWDDLTLNCKGQYTFSSDMYQLGKLIVNWLNDSREDSDEEKYIREWGEAMKKKHVTAATILQCFCKNPCARCKLFTA